MDPTMKASLKEMMRKTLDNLEDDEFKRFKHNLGDKEKIPWRKLKNADTDDTVDLMVQCYSTGAGDVLLDILKKMDQNQLAKDLEKHLEELGGQQCSPGLVNGDGGVKADTTANSGGASAMPQQGGVSEVPAYIPQPVTRKEFLQYSFNFTLDPNTAHRQLHLSKGNRRMEWGAVLQSYPYHPERFDVQPQVLCREGVSGRCYWEVEWSVGVSMTVSYRSISRKGGNKYGYDVSGFGWNNLSWSLSVYNCSSIFWHNNKRTDLPLVGSSRIGVYVDHRAGILAFYSISDIMTLVHRVQTAFTGTLYPGFWLWCPGSSMMLL